MSVCRRCIMPDSYPNVTLDSEGVCSLCRIHEASPRLQRPAAGKDGLRQVLTSRTSGQYHCVVPLSGGKDSSYALYYVTRELGLKPLAVFEDSGFVADCAKQNIKTICDALEVELVVHQARFRRRLTQEALYIWKHRGRYFSVCPPCETNNRSLAIREAAERGIPFIVWGATDFEDDVSTFLDPDSPSFRERFARGFNAREMPPRQIARRVFEVTGLGIIYRTLRSSTPWDRRLKAAFHAFIYLYCALRNNVDVDVPEGWRKYLPLVRTSFEGKGVKTVYLFDYLPYDPYEQIAILKREVDWHAPKDQEARMDCRLHSLAAYQSLKDTGITLDGFTCSVLVRYGLMTRPEAERKEQAAARHLLQDCEQLLEELGVDKEGLIP